MIMSWRKGQAKACFQTLVMLKSQSVTGDRRQYDGKHNISPITKINGACMCHSRKTREQSAEDIVGVSGEEGDSQRSVVRCAK